jgi:hypothetical protein
MLSPGEVLVESGRIPIETESGQENLARTKVHYNFIQGRP